MSMQNYCTRKNNKAIKKQFKVRYKNAEKYESKTNNRNIKKLRTVPSQLFFNLINL